MAESTDSEKAVESYKVLENADKENAEGSIKPPNKVGIRHLQYFLYFSATLFGYCLRICFNVGIIAMMEPDPPGENTPSYPEWEEHKNVMLSAFFWGYVATQLVGGQLAERYGPKWFLAFTFFITSLFSLLIPSFAGQFGYEGVIACRVIQGLSQGLLFPCIQHLLGRWAPLRDRSKASGFTYSGVSLGTVLAMPVTGLISSSASLGWPVAYYLFGACGIFWTLLWVMFGSDSPEKHKYISAAEVAYISGNQDPDDEAKKKAMKGSTPWLSILMSLPFWAILINDCGYSWGYWTLLSEIPSYMKSILNYDIAANSLMSALPYFVRCFLIIPSGILSDYLIKKKYTSVTTNRKMFNSIAMFVAAVCLFSLTFVEATDRVSTIVLLVIGVMFTAGIFSGFLINQIDLAPNYAGTIMGISNTCSNFFSLVGPLSVDGFIHFTGYQETDKELWTIIFCTASGILVIVGVFFICVGSAEVQPWNEPKTKNKKSEEEK